jgi:hypothetical protein
LASERLSIKVTFDPPASLRIPGADTNPEWTEWGRHVRKVVGKKSGPVGRVDLGLPHLMRTRPPNRETLVLTDFLSRQADSAPAGQQDHGGDRSNGVHGTPD